MTVFHILKMTLELTDVFHACLWGFYRFPRDIVFFFPLQIFIMYQPPLPPPEAYREIDIPYQAVGDLG